MTDMSPETFYAALAVFGILALVISHCAERFQRNRADNLEAYNIQLRDTLFEMHYALYDAPRDRDRYRTSNGYLIREVETMSIALARTETELSYLRSVHQRRRDVLAGTMLLSGMVREDRKMRVYEWSKV